MKGIFKAIENAIKENDATQIKVILRYHNSKVDLEQHNNEGRTLLQECCITGNLDIVRVLVDQSASLETKDKHGNTALHYACLYSHFQIARFFVTNCANVNILNFEGKQPVDVTTDKSIRLLVEMAMTVKSNDLQCMTMGRRRRRKPPSNLVDKYLDTSMVAIAAKQSTNTNKHNDRRHNSHGTLDIKHVKKSFSFNTKDRRNSWTGKVKKIDSFKRDSSKVKSKLLNKKALKLRKVASEADMGRLENEKYPKEGTDSRSSMHKVQNTEQINLVGLTLD